VGTPFRPSAVRRPALPQRIWAGLRTRGGRLGPPKPNTDGRMSLTDHIRELRYRVIISVLAVVVGTAVSAVFYRRIVAVVMWPWTVATRAWIQSTPDAVALVVNQSVTSPFLLAMKASLVAGVILACPVWLYQAWAFVSPGLVVKEKRYVRAFLGAAIPCFLLGCALGYMVLPKGIQVMLTFTVSGVTNLQDLNAFLSLELRMVLVFGLAFLVPVFLVMANRAGIVSGAALGKARSAAIFGCYFFAAAATPSSDPFSMLALGTPMAAMYLIAEIVARRHDRHRLSTEEE